MNSQSRSKCLVAFQCEHGQMMCRLRIDGDRKMLPKGLNVCEGSSAGAETLVNGCFTVSSTLPVMKYRLRVGRFECKICGATQDVEQSGIHEWIEKPLACNGPGCTNKKDFKLLDGQSNYDQEQHVALLLNTEGVHDVYDAVLDDEKAKLELYAGDKVEITGWLHESTHVLDVASITKFQGDDEMEISEEEAERIKEFARRPDVVDLLVRSLAPGVIGLEQVKTALILAMFKGIKLKNSLNRADIHVAIIGDPATGKTRLASAVMERVPIFAFASGENFGEKDEAAVHVNSYCPEGIIMLAKPKLQFWSDDLTLSENVQFGLDSLSRFDLVFIVRTPQDSEDVNLNQDQAAMEDVISPVLFKNWIQYANEMAGELCIAEDAKAKIEEAFLNYTSTKNNEDECLPITTRNLDQIIRLASARAKISLRSLVNVADIEFALAEIDASLKSCGCSKGFAL